MEIDVLKTRQKEKQKGLNTMKITPISRTNFNGYGPKEIQQLTNYAATKQKGAFYDLNKRFSTELISSFVITMPTGMRSVMATGALIDFQLEAGK